MATLHLTTQKAKAKQIGDSKDIEFIDVNKKVREHDFFRLLDQKTIDTLVLGDKIHEIIKKNHTLIEILIDKGIDIKIEDNDFLEKSDFKKSTSHVEITKGLIAYELGKKEDHSKKIREGILSNPKRKRPDMKEKISIAHQKSREMGIEYRDYLVKDLYKIIKVFKDDDQYNISNTKIAKTLSNKLVRRKSRQNGLKNGDNGAKPIDQKTIERALNSILEEPENYTGEKYDLIRNWYKEKKKISNHGKKK